MSLMNYYIAIHFTKKHICIFNQFSHLKKNMKTSHYVNSNRTCPEKHLCHIATERENGEK